jgi:hypothetical protein
MMSVCASVCPTFRSPTITQKRFNRLLSNLTNTNLPVVSRVEKLLVSIELRRVEEGGGRSKKLLGSMEILLYRLKGHVFLCRKRCLPFADFSNMADL